MSTPVQLFAFAAALVVVAGLAFGIGRAVGPDDNPPAPAHTSTPHEVSSNEHAPH